MQLLDWIDPKDLSLLHLAENPNAVDYLEDILEFRDYRVFNEYDIQKINNIQKNRTFWNRLASNENATRIIEKKINECYDVINNIYLEENVEGENNWDKENDWDDIYLFWENIAKHSKNIDLLRRIIQEGRINIDFWYYLCNNKNSEIIPLLEQKIKSGFYLDKQFENKFWCSLARNKNPDIIPLLEKKIQENTVNNSLNISFWLSLATNENAVHLLLNYNKLTPQFWHSLAVNPNNEMILRIQEKIQNNEITNRLIWDSIAFNTNSMIIPFLEKFIDTKKCTDTFWLNLATNPNPDILLLLEKKIHDSNGELYNNKYFWINLSKNPNAIDIIEKNIVELLDSEEKIITSHFWTNIARNPNGIPLLKQITNGKMNEIIWRNLSTNPNIFHNPSSYYLK